MVVPINLAEENGKKHHHRPHLKNFQSKQDIVDIEEAQYTTDDENGRSFGSAKVIDAADGVNSVKPSNEVVSEDKKPTKSKRHTFDTVALTSGSASSCKCILLPHGDTRTYWDLYICVLLVYVGTFVPYRVSFLGDLDGLMEGVELFVDISFGVDIMLNFFTGEY